MKNCKHLINTIFIILLLFTACKKGTYEEVGTKEVDIKTDTIPKHVQTRDIYVTGNIYDRSVNVNQAVYWKNEIPVILSHGKTNAFATDIAVKGNDVYVVGYVAAANNTNIATYWKNGEQVNLTNNSVTSAALAIAIHGNDVYIAGLIGTDAVYWKNGQPVTLPLLPGMSRGSSTGIAIQGSDIYVSGSQMGGAAHSTVYWKNNVATRLPTDIESYAAKNIVFQGGQLYIPVTNIFSSAENTVANYWKNNVPVSLADGTIKINAIAIAVSGSDVYLACSTPQGQGYFKNNKLTLLPSGHMSETIQINDITVIDKDVYVSGQTISRKMGGATYWKNNVPVYLSPNVKSSFTSAILVVVQP